jgi:hypothetical protein
VRGLLNLSASAYGLDPRQAYTVAREAVALARRYGLKNSLWTAAGNALESGVGVGDWEWAATEAERLLNEDLESFDQFVVYRGIEELRSYRGDPVEDMLHQHAEWVERDQGITNISNYNGAMAAFAFASGDYAKAIEGWVKSADLNSTNTGSDLPKAIRVAIWRHDEATARALVEKYDALHAFGPGPSAWRPTIAAGLAALAGNRESALSLYAEARTKWAEARVEFDGALLGVDMLMTLGAAEPAALAAAAEARTKLASLGSRPFVELIDRLTDGAATAATISSARTEPRHEVQAAVE